MPTELEAWEKKLRVILKEIDAVLEQRYGAIFPRKPVRPPAGSTCNPQYDGLFDIDAAYTIGLGSCYGEGYVVEIRWVTLSEVPDNIKQEAAAIAENILNQRLPDAFPGKNMRVVHDISGMKIIGDLALG